MILSEAHGRYFLTARESRWADLRDSGWVFDRTKRCYTTTDWRKAVDYIEWAESDELWDDLDKRMTELEVDMSASYSMFADAEITRPHITNYKGEVLDYLPYQKAGILYAAERDDTLIGDSPGLGKGQPLWAKVLTPSGWRLMGNLVVGDPIVGADGKTYHVTGVYDKGHLPVYRVEFNDGAVTHVDGDHLWKVKRKRIQKRDKSWFEPDWEIQETRELIARAYPAGIRDNKIEIPLIHGAELEKMELPLDPYLVGALLGDGGLKYHTPYFSNIDQGVLYQVMTRLPLGYVARHSDRCSYRLVPEKAGTTSNPNAITGALRSLNMMGVGADDKVIPAPYMLNSPADRLLLLQGLLDTDGYAAKDGTVQFSSNSQRLRDQVVEIVQSIGGVARKSQKVSASGKDHYITTINAPVCPFLGAKEKVERWSPRVKYAPKRMFKTISELPPEPVRCISVSAPDSLYVTDDYIVTHNTIQAIGLINHSELTSGVIVCPATLKLNWLREVLKWVADKSLTVGVAYGGEIPDTDFVIINYDILDRNKETLWGEQWDILICDEAQYLSNGESKRTQVIFGTYKMDWATKKVRRKPERIKQRHNGRVEKVSCLRANKRLMLTGTPMMKQPKDMWTIVRDFDPLDLGASWDDYAFTYCDAVMTSFGLQATGGSNLSELNEKLRRAFMIRRLKKNVLKDLPEKTRQVIVLPPEGLKKMIKTERDKFTDALAMLDAANTGIVYKKKLVLEEVDPALILDTMTMILPEGFDSPEIEDLDAGEVQPGFAAYSEARKDLALSKVPMAVEHIKRLLEAGEKVIVFGIHKDVISELYKSFPQAARIVGGMGDKKVEANKLRFQGDLDAGIEPDPECNLILCNLKAGGVGHTLTEATVVVFVEMWSVPGDMEQCEDRAHRIGLLHNVLIQFLVVDGTIDALTIQTLIERIAMIQEGVDGIEPELKMGK